MNLTEINDIITYIEDHPESWFQGEWARKFHNKTRCGTAYCIAGHAVHRAGYKICWNRGSHATECRRPDGEFDTIQTAATEVLGLTFEQASRLFSGANDMDDLKMIAKDWANQGLGE